MLFLFAGCNAGPSQEGAMNSNDSRNNLPETAADRQQLPADLTNDQKEEIILGPSLSSTPEALNEKLGGPLTVYSADGQVLLDRENGVLSVVGTYDAGAEYLVLVVMLWGGGSMGMYYGAYLYDADADELQQLKWDNFEHAVGELADDEPGASLSGTVV